jgi:hypothetical protein
MMELNNSMTGGGGCQSAMRGYEDYVDSKGKNIRVYGGLQGMTPSEYDDWWHKRGKYAKSDSKKASPPKRQSKLSLPENPTRRQPSRSAKSEGEMARRMTKGGKRKSRKGHKSHKSRKSHKSHKNRK